MIKLNDLRREFAFFGEPLLEAGASVVSSGHYLFGRATSEFSESFARYLGVKHVIPVANGTDALELAFRALGVDPTSEVICAANAGGYAATALYQLGATPVYADVTLPSLTIDPRSVAELLSERTRAVVVTHLYGNHADVAGMRAMLKSRGRGDVAVLEDCAQAQGAKRDGGRAGSHGDVAAFSFYPTKNLGALGDAGAVATSDDETARRVRLLQQYGWESRYRISLSHGRNSRMDEIQAAFLNVKLGRLDELNDRRRRLLSRYREALPAAYRLCALEGDESVGHLAVILCPDRAAAERHLAGHGVETGVHYPILDCDQAAWRSMPQRSGELRESRKAVQGILTVPCYPHLIEDEAATVCAALRSLP